MRNKNTHFAKLNAIYSKSVRLDKFTVESIMKYRGDNFSEKLRNYVFDVENGIYKKIDM